MSTSDTPALSKRDSDDMTAEPSLGIDRFGASAPGELSMIDCGLTADEPVRVGVDVVERNK